MNTLICVSNEELIAFYRQRQHRQHDARCARAISTTSLRAYRISYPHSPTRTAQFIGTPPIEDEHAMLAPMALGQLPLDPPWRERGGEGGRSPFHWATLANPICSECFPECEPRRRFFVRRFGFAFVACRKSPSHMMSEGLLWLNVSSQTTIQAKRFEYDTPTVSRTLPSC